MTATELITRLEARGIQLVADGELIRCRPKSALTQDDLALLRSHKPEILAYLRRPSPSIAPLSCFTCRSQRFWRSIHGAVVCGNCHPPATPQLVVGWVEASPRPRAETRTTERAHRQVLRVEDLPGATPQDIANITALMKEFKATIVSGGPDDSADGAA